jgi:hypothetical protein
MAPTIKIQQYILPDIVDDVNFKTVPKMDRCTTCHQAIDKVGFEKYPQPFKTHPNLDRYLGSKSVHPIDKIGCTVCHEGMGQSVSFPRRVAYADRRETEGRVGKEAPLGRAARVGLPDAADEDDGKASCVKCHKQEILSPRRAEPQCRLRDVRTCGLLCVPQDEGLRT